MMTLKNHARPNWIKAILTIIIAQTSGTNGESNRWPALTSSVATSGTRCVTPCLKNNDNLTAIEYLCDALKERKTKVSSDALVKHTRSCSPAPGLDSLGRRCYNDCKAHGGYHYCYLDKKEKEWGYCSNFVKPPSVPLIAQHMTIYGEPCISSCTHEGESYAWCYKAGGGWDYCSSKPGFGTKGKECHERKCDYDGQSYTWCWLEMDRKDWSKCGQVNISSFKSETYIGSKCLTPCVLTGVGLSNGCLDAAGRKLKCSRIPNLATNNMKCHSKCDKTGGTENDDFKEEFYWCFTSADKNSSWNECSQARDYPLLVKGSEPEWLAKVEHFPISEIKAELLISGAKENILWMQDDQGISEFTFFEKLENIGGNETQGLIDVDEKLQRVAVACLAFWRDIQFHVKSSNKTDPIKLPVADEEEGQIAVKLEQAEPYKLNKIAYLNLQLVYSGIKKLEAGARIKIAEVVVAVEVAQKAPELVVDALIRSMYGGYKVHVGRFSYDPKKRVLFGMGSTNIL